LKEPLPWPQSPPTHGTAHAVYCQTDQRQNLEKKLMEMEASTSKSVSERRPQSAMRQHDEPKGVRFEASEWLWLLPPLSLVLRPLLPLPLFVKEFPMVVVLTAGRRKGIQYLCFD
jgi:hypothetical protein